MGIDGSTGQPEHSPEYRLEIPDHFLEETKLISAKSILSNLGADQQRSAVRFSAEPSLETAPNLPRFGSCVLDRGRSRPTVPVTFLDGYIRRRDPQRNEQTDHRLAPRGPFQVLKPCQVRRLQRGEPLLRRGSRSLVIRRMLSRPWYKSPGRAILH